MSTLRARSESLLAGDIRPDDAPPMAPLFVAERVADGVGFVSSFANVTAFETDAGAVLIDTGSFLLAEPTRVLVRRVVEAPVDTAVWTHGHVDHCFGVDRYEAEEGARRVTVVAHEAVPRRFERYRLTAGYNGRVNGRQFQVAPSFPAEFRAPDQLVRDELTLEVGGRRFSIFHDLGETDDHLWVFEPETRVLCTGDLFIWASPNCGNPQKAQRYPREWAQALRKMAALAPAVLCPGHGVPIFGEEVVQKALLETAELLESLVAQTLHLLNEGARLDRILEEVRAPAHLMARPYLAPIYDEPEFVVRNLVRLYGGWWDGNPAHLLPARERDLARELAALAGGHERLVERAKALADEGELALAAHLAELAALAAPADPEARSVRRGVYAARAEAARSLMARGIFRAAMDDVPGGDVERGD